MGCGLGREIFSAETVSLNTQASKDRATADGGRSGRGGQKGCLCRLSKLPSLETNSECAPETHKQTVGGLPWSIYTSTAKAEGAAVRIGQFLLFPSLGLATTLGGKQEGMPAYPASPPVPGILQDLSDSLQ